MKFLATFIIPALSLILIFTASETLNLIFFGQIMTIFSAGFLLAILFFFGAGQTILSSTYNLEILPKKLNLELNWILLLGFIIFVISLILQNFYITSVILVAMVTYVGKLYLLQQQLNKQVLQLALAFYVFHLFKIFIFIGLLVFQIETILPFFNIVFFVSIIFIIYMLLNVSFSNEKRELKFKSRKLFFLTSLLSIASSNLTQVGIFLIFGSEYAGIFAFFMLFYGGVSLYLNKFLLAKLNKSIVNPDLKSGIRSHNKAFIHVKVGIFLTFFSWIGVNISWLFGFFSNYQPYSISINILFFALLVRNYTAWQGVWGNRKNLILFKNRIQLLYLVLLFISLLIGKFFDNFIYFSWLFFASEVILLLSYKRVFSKVQ